MRVLESRIGQGSGRAPQGAACVVNAMSGAFPLGLPVATARGDGRRHSPNPYDNSSMPPILRRLIGRAMRCGRGVQQRRTQRLIVQFVGAVLVAAQHGDPEEPLRSVQIRTADARYLVSLGSWLPGAMVQPRL